MSWTEAQVSVQIVQHFKGTLPELRKRYNKAWDHYEVIKAWVESPHVGQAFYCVHVKEGVFPNHHHYTVKFEINHGKLIFGTIEEGHKTLF